MIEYPVSKAAHALMHALRFSKGRGVVGSEVIVTRMCCVLDEKDVTYFWRGSRVALIPGSMEMEGPGMMQQQHARVPTVHRVHPSTQSSSASMAHALQRTSRAASSTQRIHGRDVTVD
jgi:hypothetical protein